MSSGTQFDYDVAVIGAGSAGYAAARTTAAAGLATVLLEDAAEVGGLCILRGCMPTKALLHCAEVLHHARHAGTFGVASGPIRADFSAVMERKNRLVAEFARYRRQQLADGPFRFIRAGARFTDAHTLCLTTGERMTARSFVIASGSKVAPAPLPALERTGYLTSDDALLLEGLPRTMIALGGGAVAVEFAQFFARMGVEVTLIQRSEHLLREMDTDAAVVLEQVLRREGLDIYTQTTLRDAWRDGRQKGVSFEHGGKLVTVMADEIFFGLGRVPNTASLHLEAAGVSIVNGRIVTDLEMRTSAEHIFAAGDCTSLHEIVHLAVRQGEVAGHNIAYAQGRVAMDYRLLATVVFSDPQVAAVGLTERAADLMKAPYVKASYLMRDHGKALLMEARDGFVKLLADPSSGEILGGAVVGCWGGELIHEIIAAMAKRMTVRELAAMPHYHPTLAEIWTYPAEELAERIRSVA